MPFTKSGLCGLALLLAAVNGAAVSGARAADGAAAKINACLYLPTAPSKAVSFKFIAGGPVDECMYDAGKDAEGVATSAGLTCVSIGTVKSKSVSSGGDFCLTADSIWTLAYIADNVRAPNGSIRSIWSNPLFGDNSIELSGGSPETYVCGSKTPCSRVSWKWSQSDVPELFVIFTPNRNR